MNKIQLNPAYFFVCPHCDADNYMTAERYEMTDEKADELCDGDASLRYELLRKVIYEVPSEVGCGQCEVHFEAIKPQTRVDSIDEDEEESWETDDCD